jgi:O-antigen/teichoic acid export membrane protein
MKEKKKTETTADDTANLSLGRSSLIGVGGKFVLAVFGFAGVVFFYRDLGPTKIGAYYSILAVIKISTQFQNSVTAAIQKRVSEVSANQSGLLGIGLLSLFIISAIGGIIVVVVSPFVQRLGLSTAHLIGGLAMVSTLGLFATINQFYTGIGNPGKANWIDAVRSVLTLAGQASLLIIGFDEFGLVWGFVFGNLVTATVLLFTVGVIPTKPSRKLIIRTLNFAKWSLPNGLANTIYNRLDVVILGWIIGSTSVGYYQPAFQLTIPATYLAASISQSLAVKSSGKDSQGYPVIEELRNGLAYAGLVSIPLFFGALAIPRELMRTIFGPSAVAGAGAVIGLALLQILKSYVKPMGSVIQAVDRPDIFFKISLIVLIINIPLAVLFASWHGLIGVVAAGLVAEFIRVALTIIVVTNLFGNPSIPREAIEQIFSAVIMFGTIEGVTSVKYIQINSIFQLIFIICMGVIVYFCTLIAVSQKFRHTVQSIVKETLSL